MKTNGTTATITNLEACESYIVTVGIVGPLGIGPLSSNPNLLVTRFNANAAPKNLSVYADPHNETIMVIDWRSSCPAMMDNIGYMVSMGKLTVGYNVLFVMKIPYSDYPSVGHGQ